MLQWSRKNCLFVACLAGLVTAGAGRASVIYSAPPNQSGGSDANGFLEADDFTLAIPARLGVVTFWSFQTVPADFTGFIAWSIRTDAAGIPGASIASATAKPVGAPTGKSAFGLHEFIYTFPVDVTLSAGRYWVVLHNGPNNVTPATDFFWEWSNGIAGDSMQQDLSSPNQPWLGNFAEFALRLDDNVPEPAEQFLVGPALLLVWLAARGRRQN